MRDSKLYKELGYSNFGDYCEQETEIKKAMYIIILLLQKNSQKNLSNRLDKLE